MTDFNFLRIKWPKLAAVAADAGRLVEVSPASAISGMQNFCEWAADIALDFYEINTQNGITQQEKLDTLKATGHVPGDILERFHDIMMSGGRRLYRENEDVEEARRCIDDVYEIGRWLNKEADRVGWPPKTDYFRPAISPLGNSGEGGGFATGRIGQTISNFKNLIIMAVVVVVIGVGATIGIVSVYNSAKANAKATLPVVTPTPVVDTTPILVTSSDDSVIPSPTPETAIYLDSLKPVKTKQSFFLGKWTFAKGDVGFTIGDKQYINGIGMYIPKASISQTQGTWFMTFNLDGKYDALKFDLGIDAGLKYETGYGKFRVQILSDTHQVYDSKLQDYTFTDLGKDINIQGCKTLEIKLTEVKGTKGTLNVVLGGIRAVQGGEADASTGESPSPDDSSASPTASATATATAKSTATATATSTDDGGGNQNP